MSHHHSLEEYYVTLLSNNSMKYYETNTLSSFTNRLPVPLNLNGNWVVGLTEMYVNSFQHQINADAIKQFRLLFIYSDIVQPRMIGDSFVKCIKLYHTDGKAEYVTFPRVEYHPVSSSTIRDITILLKDETALQADFVNSVKPTFCTLHFKKLK